MGDRAVLPLLRRARAGDRQSWLALGKLYLEGGSGLPRSPQAAYYWLEKAAKQGVEEAVYLIGDAISSSAIADFRAATPFFEQAAAAGSIRAKRVLASRMLADTGGADNAPALLLQAAEQGDPLAQSRVASLYQSGDVGDSNGERANYWYEQAARQGSLTAQQSLSDYYWSRSDPQAINWLEPLAEHGDVEACYRYGVLLLSMNRARDAASWIQRAAMRGHSEAQLAFGKLYAARGGVRENGVPHNYKKAVFWLGKAAQQGQPVASYELYQLYSLRNFSLSDAVTARRYLEHAAEQGHPQAQYLLGKALWKRKLEPDADAVAVTWLMRAGKRGHVQAKALLRSLCPPAPLVPDDVMSRRSAAIRMLARTHLAIATRLELASVFGLHEHETLFVLPAEADRGECLVLDLREQVKKSKRRIVLVDSDAQRETLNRAKRLLSGRLPAPGDLTGDLRHRLRRMELACRTQNIDPALFHALPA